jgi:hypothetical protein
VGVGVVFVVVSDVEVTVVEVVAVDVMVEGVNLNEHLNSTLETQMDLTTGRGLTLNAWQMKNAMCFCLTPVWTLNRLSGGGLSSGMSHSRMCSGTYES